MQPADAEFEKFTVDADQPSTSQQFHQHQQQLADSHLLVAANGNIRRHTVGPGDVAHEQALNPCGAINFKFDPNAATSYMAQPQIPINLPMLMNQPINTFTIKDQHLLRPPMEMGASEFLLWMIVMIMSLIAHFPFVAGAFGRRASDGGANLHIYYPASTNPSQISDEELMMMTEQASAGCAMKCVGVGGESAMESGEDSSNDEIQRYMKMRGGSKRHTVGCTDDLSVSPSGQCMEPPLAHSPVPSTSGMSQGGGSSSRTRRTGLLTVMERPPGEILEFSSFHSV